MDEDPVLDVPFGELMSSFDWESRWKYFDGDRENFNIASECLFRYVEKEPHRVAARVFGDNGDLDEFTVLELAQAAAGVNRYLDDRGIARGATVGIALQPGLAYLAAIFGIMMGGRILVPGSQVLLPPALHSRFAAAEVHIAIVESADQLPKDSPIGYPVLEGASLGQWLVGDNDLRVRKTKASDPAIYVYTSGTTGTPKRVSIPHQGLTLFTTIVGKMVLGLRESDRYLATYSNGYLGGIAWGLFVPMSVGSAAGICRGRITGDGLAHHIRTHKVTAMHSPPTAYRRVVAGNEDVGDSIRTLAFSGEPLSPEEARRIYETFGVWARSQYGASEVGLVAVDYVVDGYVHRPGSLGFPLPGSDVRVVDSDDNSVPAGTAGRIVIRRRDGMRPTGDTGHMDEDGYIWFTGRTDDLILSAGYTVSPVEVESAIRSLTWVRETAVVGVPDPDRYQVVAAFVQPDADMSADFGENAIVAAVREQVGGHAIPRIIRFVSDFPRADGNKIKKSELLTQLP